MFCTQKLSQASDYSCCSLLCWIQRDQFWIQHSKHGIHNSFKWFLLQNSNFLHCDPLPNNTQHYLLFSLTACENWVMFLQKHLHKNTECFLHILFLWIISHFQKCDSILSPIHSVLWNPSSKLIQASGEIKSALDYYQFFSVITEIFLKYHHSRSTWLKLTILTVT